jgi:hypothetical protein
MVGGQKKTGQGRMDAAIDHFAQMGYNKADVRKVVNNLIKVRLFSFSLLFLLRFAFFSPRGPIPFLLFVYCGVILILICPHLFRMCMGTKGGRSWRKAGTS